MIQRISLLFALTMVASIPALADVETWVLSDVDFDIANTAANSANGYIVFDSGAPVAWDIVVSGTNTPADFTYTNSDSGASMGVNYLGSPYLGFYAGGSGNALSLTFVAAPPVQPGPDLTVPNAGFAVCDPNFSSCSIGVSGSLVYAPEPSGVAILAFMGLASLVCFKRLSR